MTVIRCGCCDRPYGAGADLGCPDCIDAWHAFQLRAIVGPADPWEDGEDEPERCHRCDKPLTEENAAPARASVCLLCKGP